jgi:hypothetical protein
VKRWDSNTLDSSAKLVAAWRQKAVVTRISLRLHAPGVKRSLPSVPSRVQASRYRLRLLIDRGIFRPAWFVESHAAEGDAYDRPVGVEMDKKGALPAARASQCRQPFLSLNLETFLLDVPAIFSVANGYRSVSFCIIAGICVDYSTLTLRGSSSPKPAFNSSNRANSSRNMVEWPPGLMLPD